MRLRFHRAIRRTRAPVGLLVEAGVMPVERAHAEYSPGLRARPGDGRVEHAF
jgi:hypothetical protein